MFNFFKTKKKYDTFKNEDKILFLIKEKKYENVVVYFYNVQFVESEEIPKLKFNYEIVDCNNFYKEELENNNDFITTIGNILENYILEKVENFDSFRNSNT